MTFFAGKTLFVFARGLVPGFGEILIAAPAASAVRHKHTLTGCHQIRQNSAVFVEDQSANGNLQNHIRTGMAGAVGTFSVAPALRLEFTVVAIAQQSIVVGIGFNEDATAVAAVPAGRTAAGHEFFAAERYTTIAAVAGLHGDFCFVNKHRSTPFIRAEKQKAVPASQNR